MTEAVDRKSGFSALQFQPLWKVGLATAILIAMYHRVIAGLFMDWWTEPAFSYGLLVPPLTAGVIWMRREQLRSKAVKPDDLGLWVIAFGCLLLVSGSLGAEGFSPVFLF